MRQPDTREPCLPLPEVWVCVAGTDSLFFPPRVQEMYTFMFNRLNIEPELEDMHIRFYN
jgi:hypothetical protein